MRRTLTTGNDAVVAASTRSDNLRMINSSCRTPARWRVAGFTKWAGRNVCRPFSACADSVMTPYAISADTGVIKPRTEPVGRHVANIALGRGGYVACAFSPRRRAVVATRTRSTYLGMIDSRKWTPRRCRVTGFA